MTKEKQLTIALLAEKLQKLTNKKVVLKEGTWQLGNVDEMKAIGTQLINLKDRSYHIVGDDEFFNGLDSSLRRLDELIKFKTSNKPT